MCAKRLYGKLK